MGPNDLHPAVPGHRLNSTTGEQKGITQTIILTPSRPVGGLTQWCQAPTQEAYTSEFLRLWCDAVGMEPRLPHLGGFSVGLWIQEELDTLV